MMTFYICYWLDAFFKLNLGSWKRSAKRSVKYRVGWCSSTVNKNCSTVLKLMWLLPMQLWMLKMRWNCTCRYNSYRKSALNTVLVVGRIFQSKTFEFCIWATFPKNWAKFLSDHLVTLSTENISRHLKKNKKNAL